MQIACLVCLFTNKIWRLHFPCLLNKLNGRNKNIKDTTKLYTTLPRIYGSNNKLHFDVQC